jgi:hypothetical protein
LTPSLEKTAKDDSCHSAWESSGAWTSSLEEVQPNEAMRMPRRFCSMGNIGAKKHPTRD